MLVLAASYVKGFSKYNSIVQYFIRKLYVVVYCMIGCKANTAMYYKERQKKLSRFKPFVVVKRERKQNDNSLMYALFVLFFCWFSSQSRGDQFYFETDFREMG